MKNKKANAAVFEDVQFNDYAYAKDQAALTETKMKRSLIGVGIAAVSTVLSIVGFSHSGLTALLGLGFVLAIVSYIIGGGFGMALRLAKKIAVIGWIIVPFPLDIITGLVTFFVAIYCFLFIPVVFVLLSYFQLRRINNEAKNYLQYYERS